jgi:hypothetical protein
MIIHMTHHGDCEREGNRWSLLGKNNGRTLKEVSIAFEPKNITGRKLQVHERIYAFIAEHKLCRLH